MQFIPARGRKRFKPWIQTQHCSKLQFIPARGRKPVPVLLILTADKLQFIPARGRKPFEPFCSFSLESYCNLSPRGDGNLTAVGAHQAVMEILQFIPARGRKLSWSFVLQYVDNCNLSPRGDGNIVSPSYHSPGGIAIYPREGTETVSHGQYSANG